MRVCGLTGDLVYAVPGIASWHLERLLVSYSVYSRLVQTRRIACRRGRSAHDLNTVMIASPAAAAAAAT